MTPCLATRNIPGDAGTMQNELGALCPSTCPMMARVHMDTRYGVNHVGSLAGFGGWVLSLGLSWEASIAAGDLAFAAACK